MGNCQAIDNASLALQHPNGRTDKMYVAVTASQIMKMNPGHYVALLLTTTFSAAQKQPLRVTRIKLLKPTDTLAFGHVYRLITAQEVMKGLWAKKYAKMKKQMTESSDKELGLTAKEISDLEAALRKYELQNTKVTKQIKHERQRSKTSQSANSVSSKSSRAAWQPSLQSISEAANAS